MTNVPPDTDLSQLPVPKEGEPWSIVRGGVYITGVGPWQFDEEPEARRPLPGRGEDAVRARPRP